MQRMLLISESYHSGFMMQMHVMMSGFIQLALLPSPRRCWVYERQDCWFQDLWDHRFDDDYQGGNRWKRDFRMTIETFKKLIDRLTPILQKRDTVSTFLLFYI